MGTLGWQELLIILVVVVIIFGGSRLAGLGKASGKAIREFKEETRGLREQDEAKPISPSTPAEGEIVTDDITEHHQD